MTSGWLLTPRGQSLGAAPPGSDPSIPSYAFSGSAPDRIVAIAELLHVLAILLDGVADLGGALTREGTGVGHRTAESHVIAHDVGALGIGLHIVEVHLLHAELAGFVASVVGLVPF